MVDAYLSGRGSGVGPGHRPQDPHDRGRPARRRHIRGWSPPPPKPSTSCHGVATGTSRCARFHYDAVEIRSVDDSFIANRPGLSWFRLQISVGGGRGADALRSFGDPRRHGQRQCPRHRPRPVAVRQSRHHPLLPPSAGRATTSGCIRRPIQQPTGIGVTDTWLFDQTGALGRINQAQLIEPRLDAGTLTNERSFVNLKM